MSALRAERLTARYPTQPSATPALIDVDLDLEAGERLLLVGPNGAGKSTFIRVFAGLMRAAHGKALVAGLPARAARARVGVVSHVTYLYDELTALENLRLFGELYGVREASVRGSALLDELGVGRLRDVQVGQMSRGQQQRVTLARALLHDPPILLFDEPDTGLDVAAFEQAVRLATEPGRTVVLTTHNLANGLRICTRVGILARGRLVHEEAGAALSDAASLRQRVERLARA